MAVTGISSEVKTHCIIKSGIMQQVWK